LPSSFATWVVSFLIERWAMSRHKVLLAFAGQRTTFFPELPLSVLYLAWALRERQFEVEILDMRLRDYREIRAADYLLVGISSVTGSAVREGVALARHIRSLNPQVPVVWGGVHASMLPEQTLASPWADVVVRGEGERTLQELAQAYACGTPLDAIVGISFRKDGHVTHNPDREFMDLNQIPIELPYELLAMDRYNLESFPVHTSRGCPYRCGFCACLAMNRRHWRCKSAARVLDEVAYVVKRFKAKSITFAFEDEFFIDVKRVREICQGLIDRNLAVTWATFCRFNSFRKVDDELLALMKKSGCKILAFGVESGSQRILDTVIQKDIKLEWVMEATARLAGTGISQLVSFMSGLPGETEADMEKSFQLIDRLAELNPDIYVNGLVLYTPYPGTPLFDRVVKEHGYQHPQTLEAWADFGIYREVGATWHPKAYLKKYKMISMLSRFPFWKKRFALADVSGALVGSRFARFPFNVAYWLMVRLAMWRWRNRFFKFPVEYWVLEKALMRIRGFV